MKRKRVKQVLLFSLVLLFLLSIGACKKNTGEQEAAAPAAEEQEPEPDPEPEMEPVAMDTYVEDENEYGNSIGNIDNMGLFILNPQGLMYFYNYYENKVFLTVEEDGLSTGMTDEGMYYMNFLDEKLYGVQDDGSIAVLGLNEGTTDILREGMADYLQVVNDTMYYKEMEDNTLRSMPAEGGEETILVDEPVYYPVVYKDLIFFQLDSDNESLYCMPRTGGEMTKLNDVVTYKSMIYHDKIYYQAKDGEATSLYKMNLDGSGVVLLDEENPSVMNIYGDTLYYVTVETPNQISCLNLSAENAAPEQLDLTGELLTALRVAYGENEIQEVIIDSYLYLNFYGKYMLFMCEETIDGESYADEYIYNLETEEITVIPVFCQTLESMFEQEMGSGGQQDSSTQGQEQTQEQTPSRSYPAGKYSPGSVYGPKLSQTQLDQVADAVTGFLQAYDTASMDDYTKVLTAHDYLCNTCSYAPDWSQNGANTAWGALIYHEAQCSGYARAMKALCDAMGVGCYYVHADANASNPSHQWNECCVNGNWYIVDVQCNDSSGYKAFFLVSDDTYAGASGMSWDRTSVPACPANY